MRDIRYQMFFQPRRTESEEEKPLTDYIINLKAEVKRKREEGTLVEKRERKIKKRRLYKDRRVPLK